MGTLERLLFMVRLVVGVGWVSTRELAEIYSRKHGTSHRTSERAIQRDMERLQRAGLPIERRVERSRLTGVLLTRWRLSRRSFNEWMG